MICLDNMLSNVMIFQYLVSNPAKFREMPIKKWFYLIIKQSRSKFIYEILIDNEVVYKFINRNPRTFHNVNGYLGNSVATVTLESVASGPADSLRVNIKISNSNPHEYK